ncbi:MAG: ribosome maturation factor RimP [Ruminococcaceae bacterium]|nr:ribosome maturation factor RimP [Oscillospiraceae bacterium]
MAKGMSVAETVRGLAEPIAESIGCWLWDVEYVKEGARRILRITIDSEEGVTIDDCERMHRAIDPVLDEADPIEEQYYLEVSSPGIERELKTEEHILACEGWDVEVRLYAPLNGSKLFRGVLMEPAENGDIRIEASGAVMTFPRNTVAKLQTYFEL